MKKVLALASALIVGTAFAQSGYESDFDSTPADYGTGSSWGADDSAGMGTGQGDQMGNRHMFGFTFDSSILGMLSFDKNKVRGQDADNDTHWNLDFNYAYSLPMHPRLQLGTRVSYLKDVNALGDQENYGLQLGAIYNLSDDLHNAFYGSIFAGMQWNNDYGQAAADDEVRIGTLAVGKRFNLERWGIKHVTYTPEIALQVRNSTTNRRAASFDYSQDLQIRFLQFSVFF